MIAIVIWAHMIDSDSSASVYPILGRCQLKLNRIHNTVAVPEVVLKLAFSPQKNLIFYVWKSRGPFSDDKMFQKPFCGKYPSMI